MSVVPKAISRLIESFEKLPGIGPKSAQRLVFYLLHVPQKELDSFAQNILNLKTQTVLCSVCKNVAESDPCSICSNPSRSKAALCVVEQPTDVLSVERTRAYNGVYHVLHGVIDPLNNIGPDEIFIGQLISRIKTASPPVEEVILALNSNMEGEATSLYIRTQIRGLSNGRTVAVSRLAHGLPVGADLEYTDEVTLSRALEGRRAY